MIALALEFSSSLRSAAVGEVNGGVLERVLGTAESNQHSTTSLALVEAALREAQVEPNGVDEIVVSAGPGSYTGIRSAIAIAQGWVLARDVRTRSVETMNVLALEALKMGIQGTVRFIIDAQRKEVYSALYRISGDNITLEQELQIVPITILAGSTEISTMGPDAERLLPGAKNLHPSAATLLEVAPGLGEIRRAEELAPIYLRQTTFVKAPPPRQI